MKINSLYISAFGGIKNLTLNFTDGFNVICGNNENGKSTVMAFIKMMFYGSERGSSQISKNVRKKYTPWDNSAMSGSITFEHNGKNYRLEREFHSSNSTDKATLCDLDFGTRQAVGADVGTKFFGLSAAAFERSVFINQFGYPESDSAAEGEINTKLSNIVLTGDESVSFETVNMRLEKAKLALMSKSGRAGEYDKGLKRCGELKEKIQSILNTQSDYDEAVKRIALAEEKTKLMQKKASELKIKLSAEQDIKNAEKLRDFLRVKEELDLVKEELKLLDGSLADGVYLGKLRFCISKAQTAQNRREAKQQEIATLEKSLQIGLDPQNDETLKANIERLKSQIAELEKSKADYKERISELKAEYNEASKNKGRKFPKAILFVPLIVLFTLLTVIFVFVFKSAALPMAAAAADAVAIACFAALLISDRKRKQAEIQKTEYIVAEIDRLESELKGIEQTVSVFSEKVSIEEVNAALSSNADILERQRELLKEETENFESLKNDEQEALNQLLTLFSRYKPANSLNDVLSCIEKIDKNAAKLKEIKNRLNFINRDIGTVSYDEARRKLDEIAANGSITTGNFDELKEEYERLTDSITEQKTKIAAAKAEANAAISSCGDLQTYKAELKALTEKTAKQKAFCLAADIAIDVLRESFAEVRRSYGSVLEKKAGKIFAQLTDDKYGSMGISKAFDINVSENDNFGSRDIGYLSSGTADQAYLSLRLALSELICDGKETLPLMLDDALTQYDDARMNAAIEYLKEYSEKSQIIMFTCHNSISEAAAKSGAELISI